MKKIFKFAMLFMAVTTLSLGMVACGDDDDNPAETPTPTPSPSTKTPTEEEVRDSILRIVNLDFVEKTVIATYAKLANDCGQLQQMVSDMKTQDDLLKVCDQWKVARQDWELSESFLFGAASGYGIDPHIDTWPFAEASFNNAMSKFSPATNEADAAYIDEQIATSQNFTGFHALEYVIFREGKPRNLSDLTPDEQYFANGVAADLHLSACRLEVAWASVDAPKAHRDLVEEAELTPDDEFGREFIIAGEKGSRWKSVLEASIQIIDGCIDIIGEVADSKIASAYTGDDDNYIESPHAYNSVTDFYDNIRGCKQSLYGGLSTINATSPAKNSLMDYCLQKYPDEANDVVKSLENALTTIDKMKRPFVLNYTDPTAGAAIEALHDLDDKLSALKLKLDPTAAE